MSPLPRETLSRLSMDYGWWTLWAEGRCLALDDPIWLGRESYESIVEASHALHALIEKTIRQCLNRPELLSYFGFRGDLLKMIRADLRRGDLDRCLAPVGRYDFFVLENGGIAVSEFNTDVCAGMNETRALYEAVHGAPDAFPAPDLWADLVMSRRPERVAEMYPTGFVDDFEQGHFLLSLLERRGVRTAWGSPANFEFNGRRLWLFGEPVDVVYRYFLSDWMAGLACLDTLLEAHARGAASMISGFAQLVAQSKKIMAFWYDHPELLTPEEAQRVRRWVPRTRLYRNVGRRRAVLERQHIVLKKAFGHMGNEVVLGPLVDPDEFEAWLDWIDGQPEEWVVQDFFQVAPFWIGERTVFPCYGAYVIDGRFGGFYTRVEDEPYISYTAQAAATFVRDR